MLDLSSRSAHQRFALCVKLRAAKRARRRRLAGAAMLPLTLLSCVAGERGSRRVELSPQGAEVSRYAVLPAIAVSGRTPSDPIPFANLALTGPSFVATLNQRDRMRATLCLASAIYYEAATEPDEGQRAVAQVVLNRVRHREWPQTICGVVYQGSSLPGCQFSFACDGAMARGPMLSAWIRARRVAERALAGEVYAPVGSATFYHTTKVSPTWGRRMTPVAVVGAHIFYRMPGDSPDAASLPMLYAGREPHPGPLPRVAPPAQLLAISMPVPVIPAQPIPPALPQRVAQAAPPPSSDSRYIPGALPDSTVRDEFRDSGQWIAK